MNLALDIEIDPGEDKRALIATGLGAFNLARSGWDGSEGGIAIYLRDGEGQVQGGLWGEYQFDWLQIGLVFVPEVARGRGLGRQLLQEAERFARDRDLHGIWLDTFSFQAPDFYRKFGFGVVGQIADNPVGHSRIFMAKPLA